MIELHNHHPGQDTVHFLLLIICILYKFFFNHYGNVSILIIQTYKLVEFVYYLSTSVFLFFSDMKFFTVLMYLHLSPILHFSLN